MPFVTNSGGRIFENGIIEAHKDLKGNLVEGNGQQVVRLAAIAAIGLDQESEEFKLQVIRGNPRPNGTTWESGVVPVFIIQHYGFDKGIWERFLADYERQLVSPVPSYIYEPAVYDIIDNEFGKREFPLWVIEYLEKGNAFKKALNERKMESLHFKLTETQLKMIEKAIEERKKLEKAKVT